MASQNINWNQIARVDGNKCFLEVVSNAFNIQKVQINFFQYDLTRQQGDRFTANIPIYLGFKDFNNLFYNTILTGNIFRELDRLSNDPSKKEWEKQIILHRGGFKKDGIIKARDLKIFRGTRKPIVLRAEYGPGKENQKGAYYMAGAPEKYVDIGMEYIDFTNMMLNTWRALQAFETMKAMEKKHADLLFEISKLKDLIVVIASAMRINPQQINQIIERKDINNSFQQNNDAQENYRGQQARSTQTYQNRGDGNMSFQNDDPMGYGELPFN